MSHSQADVESVRAPLRRRRGLWVALVCVGAFVLLLGASVAWRLAGVESVAQVGVPVAIPGGTVTLDDIEHVVPEALGAPLPSGSHAVQVSLTLTADEQAPTIVSAADFVIEGTGVTSPISASSARPQDATVPRGKSISMVLVFAVPDESTDLVMTSPGGALLTADHDDHPGDSAE